MKESLKIKKIEKLEIEKNNSLRKVIRNTTALSLCGLYIFAGFYAGCESEAELLIMGGSVLFGTISIISLVKSICNIYQINERIKFIENEDRQK